MPRRKPFLAGVYVHICNRGFNKQQLFFDENDYTYFIKLFMKHLKRYHGIKLIEYCILPNHFHFVFLNKQYGFNISNLLSKVLAGYSKYFERNCGKEKGKKLLEGPFKANILDTEEYLDRCKFYVRHNAVKHGLVTDMLDWNYSSFHLVLESERQNDPRLVINRFGQYPKRQSESEWGKEEENPDKE